MATVSHVNIISLNDVIAKVITHPGQRDGHKRRRVPCLLYVGELELTVRRWCAHVSTMLNVYVQWA